MIIMIVAAVMILRERKKETLSRDRATGARSDWLAFKFKCWPAPPIDGVGSNCPRRVDCSSPDHDHHHHPHHHCALDSLGLSLCGRCVCVRSFCISLRVCSLSRDVHLVVSIGRVCCCCCSCSLLATTTTCAPSLPVVHCTRTHFERRTNAETIILGRSTTSKTVI